MQPNITTLTEKKLVGKRLSMSVSTDRTPELWRSFMAQQKEITQAIGPNLFNVKLYEHNYFEQFDPNASFEKWAAVEVADFENVPDGLEVLTLPAGLYAVFYYQGSNTDYRIYQYIYGEWLPSSKEYELDDRPHFDLLDEKYRNNDPSSEEEIWIPIRLKSLEG